MESNISESQKDFILYIDDDDLNLESFKALFEDYYDIVVATTASDALELLPQHPVKVIVSDQRMPGMSGVEFFAEIQKQYPDPIRILLTGFSDFETIKNAVNLGHIYSYVNKPMDYQYFQILLKQAIETYDLRINNRHLINTLQSRNEALQQSEERFIHIAQSVSDYVYFMILKGNGIEKIEHNPACKLLTGYEIDEFKNNPSLWYNIIYNDDRNLFDKKFVKIISFSHHDTIEYRLVKKSGDIIWINNTIKLFKENIDGSFEYNGVIKDITEKKLFQQKMLEIIIETEENERRRFAGDLHDELGPQLASMRIYLSALKKRATTPDQIEIIDEVMGLISHSIDNVRELSYNLSPHLLENYGLVAALDSEIDSKENLIHIRFDHNIQEIRFDRKVEITIYRIVKELINNSIKYSQASNISLSINFDINSLKFEYSDNGVGFDYEELISRQHKGIGLLNIQSRVNSLNGQSYITSSPGKGFQFAMNLETVNIIN